jgi:hypothetical protein
LVDVDLFGAGDVLDLVDVQLFAGDVVFAGGGVVEFQAQDPADQGE